MTSNHSSTRPPPKAIAPQDLGAKAFRERYSLRYAYLTGAMYRTIASKEMVAAMGEAGLMGSLGTAGLPLDRVEQDLRWLYERLRGKGVFSMNLLCHLDDPQMEWRTVQLYLKYAVTVIDASAFTHITPALVYYRARGLTRTAAGGVRCRNQIMAKLSRPEVAEEFLSPAPPRLLNKLVKAGHLSQAQAAMAAEVPMAHDLIVEADSGGHTDQGIATVLLPAVQAVRDRLWPPQDGREPVHIGLAGGLGTPQAIASAFTMGADFVLTGSINQCTVEAGTSDAVKDMLEQMRVQDTAYAPAPDMFELGAKVQVLKQGTQFSARGNHLYALYKQYSCWDEIPPAVRQQLEKRYFRRSFDSAWGEVVKYYENKGERGPLEQAQQDPRRRMVMVFLWYFATSSAMALEGDPEGQMDYQIQTGPALGAFNQWVRGTELASWRQRRVADLAQRLMQSAADALSERYRGWLASTSTPEPVATAD